MILHKAWARYARQFTTDIKRWEECRFSLELAKKIPPTSSGTTHLIANTDHHYLLGGCTDERMSGPRRKPGRGGGRSRRPGRGAPSTGRVPRITNTSPLHLPHVKVTIRNISSHETIGAVVDDLREFLKGAFSTNGTNDGSAYMMACQKEKEEFEKTKTLLEINNSSLGWTYEDKFATVDLPSPEMIVDFVEKTMLEEKKQPTIDSAMSQMMNECGKVYLTRVGGKITLEEESVVMVTLAEQIAIEKKRIGETKAEMEAENESQDRQVEEVTSNMEKLTTTPKPSDSAVTAAEPTTRIRILSVTPVKKSKRRGDIGARVEFVLYPPDPCMIFKDVCQEAGKIAAERYHVRAAKKDVVQETRGEDATNDTESDPSTNVTQQAPIVPNFPRLSPAERSRAIARSRILMDRTISAMKLHAQYKRNGWEIIESWSQKTWKGQSVNMVSALMNGASLSDLLEAEESKNDGDKKIKRGTTRSADRYDSTIKNSEDYKQFIEVWMNGGSVPTETEKSKSAQEEEKLDDEGRPLSAIVQHLQTKRQEEARLKAEAKAAAARARAKASAEANRQNIRKKELEAKTRKAKARMKRDEDKKKKKAVGNSSGREKGVSKPAGGAPPAGAVILKKGVGPIPTSGFNSK